MKNTLIQARNIGTMKVPVPGDLLHSYGNYTASTTVTTPDSRCLIIGSAVVLGSGYSRINYGSINYAGIPYTEGTNTQIFFSFFAEPNKTLSIEINNGIIQDLTAYGVNWI